MVDQRTTSEEEGLLLALGARDEETVANSRLAESISDRLAETNPVAIAIAGV
jgi:hypothetical protein